MRIKNSKQEFEMVLKNQKILVKIVITGAKAICVKRKMKQMQKTISYNYRQIKTLV